VAQYYITCTLAILLYSQTGMFIYSNNNLHRTIKKKSTGPWTMC